MKMLSFTLGTRPEIIKLAPLIRRARAQHLPFEIVHTGQHYDAVMDGIFFQELDLPPPVHNLHAAAPSHIAMIAKMLTGLEEYWSAHRPSAVVVEGDVNSVFAAAFCAKRMGIPVAHVEAGLRSDDPLMPEEWNRILTDRLSDRLYAPTEEHAGRLCSEGIAADCILVTGNTIADAVSEHKEKALQTELPSDLRAFVQEPFALLTLHRPALVDDPERFPSVLHAIDSLLSSLRLRGILLAHPRTQRTLPRYLSLSMVTVHAPVGYFPMLHLLQRARVVFTDSGGIQEEAALLHLPCITVRENTERPETVRAGGNRVVGFDAAALAGAATELLGAVIDWKPLYPVACPSDVIMNDLHSRYL